MHKKKPVNLDLSSLSYPPMAIASILHRISGIILFLLIPFILYLLGKSLRSPADFTATRFLLTDPFYKFMLLAFCAALIYHFLAGLRHLLMDVGMGESLDAGRRSAILVMLLALVLTILTGIWLW